MVYDGRSATAPLVRTTVRGSTQTIEAPSPQGFATFQSWSDGGARQHDVTVGRSNATFTATFHRPTIVTFDDRAGENQPLNGQYPAGVIDWGTDAWYHAGPWGQFTTRSVGFNGVELNSGTFTFLTARRLVGFDLYNGGGTATTITASCSGQTKTVQVPAGELANVTTGFATKCTTVTLSSSNGWDTNFDNLAFDDGGSAPPDDTRAPRISDVRAGSISTTGATITWTTDEDATGQVEYGPTTAYGSETTESTTRRTSHSVVLSELQPNTRYHYRVEGEDAAGNAGQSGDRTFTTASGTPASKRTVTFDDKAGQDQPLDGQYPDGVIDWRSGKWWHAGAAGKLTTRSVSFSGDAATSESFHFITPHKLVNLQAYNRGGTKSTLTLSCAGNPTRTATLPAGKMSKVKSRWADPCDSVTLSSSNGRDTSFDNLRLR